MPHGSVYTKKRGKVAHGLIYHGRGKMSTDLLSFHMVTPFVCIDSNLSVVLKCNSGSLSFIMTFTSVLYRQ